MVNVNCSCMDICIIYVCNFFFYVDVRLLLHQRVDEDGNLLRIFATCIFLCHPCTFLVAQWMKYNITLTYTGTHSPQNDQFSPVAESLNEFELKNE